MADENHDDDNENVHNPVMVRGQKIKYTRLLELDETDDQELIEAGIDINEIELQRCIENIKSLLSMPTFAELDEDSKVKVLYVLSAIKGGNDTIISLTENNTPVLCISIFNIVWRRINHPDNLGQKNELVKMFLDKLTEPATIRETNDNDLILQIVFDAMQVPDSYNPLKFELVCPYGIISNIIDTLTLLDVDPILQKPLKDMCELRNEAYLTAYRILCELLDKEDMEEIYNKEEDLLTDAEATKLKKFESKVRLRIKKQLNSDYNELVDKKKLMKIIKDAFAGCCL